MGEKSVQLSHRESRPESHHAPASAPLPKSMSSSKIHVGRLGSSEASGGSVLDEDMTIAQNLLNKNPPSIHPRGSSYGRTSTTNARPVLLDDITSSTHYIEANKRRRGYNATSNTWTSSSGEISDTDDVDSRAIFVEEYNKIANHYGIPVIVPDEYEATVYDTVTISAKKDSWFMKRLLRRTTSMLSIKSQKDLRLERSTSAFSIRTHASGKDSLKDKHLAELVRLCGSSPFYLPTEYAAGTLRLPTCFRATAQYLVQRGPALRGIFRISGSQAIVSALYDHYASQDEDGDAISGTVRCPTLPDNINCDEHDVASAFKKFLSGLPGGILGKMWLFEALVSIHDQLGIDPEMTKTRQTKVRARLIACAISSHQSKFQRDLICSVFGLLCMIGRAAETAVREDEAGRPLPTHGLMGYGSLGTIFGPLLIGELMDEYDFHREEKLLIEAMKANTPPKKEKKAKHKKTKSVEEILMDSRLASEKMKVANRVAEMLITHWRDVVRHMKNMASMTDPVVETRKLREMVISGATSQPSLLRPSASDNFFPRRPPDWETGERSDRYGRGSGSPTLGRNPLKPAAALSISHSRSTQTLTSSSKNKKPHKHVHRQRSRPRTHLSQMVDGQKSMNILTPPREDRNDARFDDIASREPEPQSPTNPDIRESKTSSASATSSSSKKGASTVHAPDIRELKTSSASKTSSSSKKGASTVHATSEGSNSTFKAGSFNERNANSPRVLRKSSPFKANVGRVDESEGYEASTEEDRTSTRGSALSPKEQLSHNIEPVVKLDDKNTAKPVVIIQDAENSLPLSPESLTAPVALRYTGQSPSFHLERVLSSHASPNGPRHQATDPARGFPAASPSNTLGLRSSFSPSDDLSLNNNEDATSTTYNRSRYSKDPLKRISKAEDMASLQSLGQALASSTEGSDDVPLLSFSEQALKYINKSLSTSGTRSPAKSESLEMTPGRLPRSSIDKFRPLDETTAAERPHIHATPTTLRHGISTPTNSANTPATPKTDTRPPRPVFQGRLNSVKSLAAKFDNPQPPKAASPTPLSRPLTAKRERAVTMDTTRTASVNKWRGAVNLDKTPLATPSSVLSSYTTNPSPSPSRASMISRNSIKSPRSIATNQAQRQRRVEASENGPPRRTPAPRTPQPFNGGPYIANRIFHTGTSSPQSPNRKRSTRNSSEEKQTTSEKSALTTTSYGVTPNLQELGDVSRFSGMPASSRLPQGGDANASFALTRPPSISRPPGIPHLPSIGRVLPRPTEPPVAMYINTRAHTGSQHGSNSPALSSDLRDSSLRSSVVSPTFLQPSAGMTPDSLSPKPALQGRGASMLYAQISSMQKAMDAKNEEIDTLKRQLATKSSLMDRGSLSEQLREQKRETAMWRDRALVAERRLDRMGQLVPGTVGWHGSHENRGETGGLSSETKERLSQAYADSEAMEQVHADGSAESRRFGEMDGAGDVCALPRTKAALDADAKTTKQGASGSGFNSGAGSGPTSTNALARSAHGSLPASVTVSGSNSQSASTSGSNSGLDLASDSNNKQSNSTAIRTTTHGGGMDGVMSSEESERSNESSQSQGTVLRRTVARRSTVDLMDFGSEDSGVVLVVPLVPERSARKSEQRSGKSPDEGGVHVEGLFELA